MPGREMSQKTAILDLLKRGPVTPLDALSKLGVFRLAARVRELREEGHSIVTHIEHRATRISPGMSWNSVRADRGKENAS